LLAFDYVALYGAPTYDFEKAYCQHRSLLDVLYTGTPDDARKFFEDMLEVFRAQDIGNLHSLGLNSTPIKDVPKRRPASKRRTAR
jgi:hypothetical protein